MTIARLVVLAIVCAATPARAQSAEADVLFREGKKLLKQGKIGEACDKLDASERIESSVGTLLNLADCREKNHQLATAWATFRKAVVAAKNARDGKREREARRREKLLAPRLSYLSVNVPDGHVDGLAITRNGVEVDHALWNQSVPIDAGSYELVAAADGYVSWTKHVKIGNDAEKAEIEVPALESKPKPVVATQPKESIKRPINDVTRVEAKPSRITGTRGLAIAVAVVGVGGVAAGIAFGVRGKHLEQQSDALCPTTTCDDPNALSFNSTARRDALIANIGMGAG
ncbi:MAG TPA: hypothetical protein VGO00_16610, partial [Kofleriaceae bacterium]|nr:hypothetical protein [Kofleriaceae bacterium]